MINVSQEYHDDIIRAISELVQIPTVYDAASITAEMPYGKKVYEGYQWLKKKALEDGFEVIEYDGYALAIRIKGKCTEERIDVVSHVDVVEPGDGWSESPYSGNITKDYIYGRGTQDMKGALILTYYALKYIKEHQFPCKKELRVVIGCDEERTMEDLRYYISKAGEPAFAFTPDGKFPFSLGEKGALMWSIDADVESCIEELDGGVQCNVVSPVATAIVNDVSNYPSYQEALLKADYSGELQLDNNKLRITVHGKAAHASKPEEGLNATVKLLGLIYEVNKDKLAGSLYHCFCDSYGEGAAIHYDIAPMGTLTLNLGILRIKNKTLSANIDCRYPNGVTSGELTEKLQKALGRQLKVTLRYDDKPTLADSNSAYVNELLQTYREISGDYTSEPFISGGVTYSKAIKHCVAYGPMLESDLNLAHQADERIEIEKIDKLFKIYTQTMIRLAD